MLEHRFLGFWFLSVSVALLGACGISSTPQQGPPDSSASVVVPQVAETAARVGANPQDAALWLHAADPARSVVLSASEEAGLEIYDLAGRRIGGLADAKLSYVEVTATFSL